MKKFILGLVVTSLSISLVACTDNPKTIKVLSDQGYTNITITGYKAFSCNSDDTIRTGFTATSIAGKSVSGTVCTGFLKGSTIRLD